MFLTVPLLNKASFLGSLINKCRQVVRIKTVNKLETNMKPNMSTTLITTENASITDTLTSPASSLSYEQKTNRPVLCANLSLSSISHGSKTLEEKVGLPPKPKKPLSPFFRYLVDRRSQLTAAKSSMHPADIAKLVSKEWKTVDESLKQRLLKESLEEHKKYIEAKVKYDTQITTEQRSQMKAIKKELLESREKRMMRKRIKELGKPRKASSAYLLYLSKEITLTPRLPNESYREWHKKITAKWHTMSDAEKNIYVIEAREGIEIYREEISLWEQKMIRLGHLDVIRHSNLIDPPEPKSKKRAGLKEKNIDD